MSWLSGNVPGYAIDRYVTGNYGEDGYAEPEVVCTCDRCGREISEGDTYYDYEGEIICTDCVEDDEDLDDYEKEAKLDDYNPWED